ncbi:hypothetical protein Phum_PHUM184900 [Pediculus humanus corporis]|uniref:Death domain-containing protein n=1 Tax=Pediculus humanus subsp. corporis TaxID=121224 RepID=E0VGJ6_PEDHC|nr:uncharacterized protein Phum_PHUM184900 [Pediculus humanus corporis]EEB12502.1 hypothetical protein Phum_PHUM184900 [Pediculus humanus corporis]
MGTKISLNLIKNWQKLISDIDFTDLAALLIQDQIITVDEYQTILVQTESRAMENFLVMLLKKDEETILKFAEILKKDYSWIANNLLDGIVKEEGHDEIDASPVTRLDVKNEIDHDISSQNTNSTSVDCEDYHSLNSLNKTNKMNNTFNFLNNKRTIIGRKRVLKARIKNDFHVTDEVISIVRKSPLISKSWTTIAHALGLTDRVHEIRFKVVLHGEDLSMSVVYLIKDWLKILQFTISEHLSDVMAFK